MFRFFGPKNGQRLGTTGQKSDSEVSIDNLHAHASIRRVISRQTPRKEVEKSLNVRQTVDEAWSIRERKGTTAASKLSPARNMQSADVEDHAVIDRLQRGVGEAPHRPVRATGTAAPSRSLSEHQRRLPVASDLTASCDHGYNHNRIKPHFVVATAEAAAAAIGRAAARRPPAVGATLTL